MQKFFLCVFIFDIGYIMKIQLINNRQIFASPNFKSIYYNHFEYKDYETGVIRETQNTTGERYDINYLDTAKLIEERFKDFKRVNIMPMNVSDGTEGYFLGGALIKNEGLETAKERYFPMYCTDICEDVIEKFGKQKRVFMEIAEAVNMKYFVPDIFQNISNDAKIPLEIAVYISKENGCFPSILNPEYDLYQMSPKYRDLFKFGVMDFRQRLDALEDEGNTVAIIRNCLKQSFGENYTKEVLIPKFAEKLKGASLLMIGDYDRKKLSYNGKLFPEMLKDAGFVEIMYNIFGRADYPCVKNIKRGVKKIPML